MTTTHTMRGWPNAKRTNHILIGYSQMSCLTNFVDDGLNFVRLVPSSRHRSGP